MDFCITRILPVYCLVIGLISVFVTILDKRAARRHTHRVPERRLMLLAFAGGALPMYTVMLLIRHKTLHKKFMIGLPVFILLHIFLLAALLYGSGLLQLPI